MRRKKINQLMRVTVSLCLVAFLCLAVFSAYNAYRARENQRARQLERYATALEQLRIRLDGDFRDLWQIVPIVEKQERLRPISMEDGRVSDQLGGITELKNLLLGNQLLYDVGMYYRKPEFLLTSSGVYWRASIETTYYRYENLSQQRLLERLETAGAGMTRIPWVHGADTIYQPNSKSQRQVVTLLYPVPYWSQTPYATLMLQVDAPRLTSALSLGGLDGCTMIVDNAGQPVISSQPLSEQLTQALNEGLWPEGSALQKVRLQEQEYYLASLGSRVLSFRYLLCVPAQAIEAASPQGEKPMFYLLSVAALLVLCYGLILWSYSPMRALVAGIQQAGGHGKRLFLNEQDCILDQFRDLAQENRALHSQISQSLSTVRESLIIRLVARQYEALGDVLALCRRAGIRLEHGWFAVALIHFTGPVCAHRAYARLAEESELHVVCEVREDTLLALLCCARPEQALAEACLDEFLDQLTEAYPPRAALAVGSWVNGLSALNRSYRSASQAVERIAYQGLDGIQFADTLGAPKDEGYPVDLVYNLKYSLLRRDRTQAEQCVRHILASLTDANTPLHVAQLTARDAVQVIKSQVKGPQYSPSTEGAQEGSPARQLVEQVNWYWQQYWAEEPVEDAGGNMIIENVLLYIEEHLERPDFSIRTISAHFGMTESAFSHMFKRQLKRNFISYINELKIQRAQQLLMDTNLTVEEVALQLGYSTSSNFSRMFKTAVNCTPSQYRQTARGMGESV